MTPAEVVAMVAGVCGVSVADMQSKNSDHSLVYARTIAVTMLLEDKVPNKAIRALFANHSRVSILYNSRWRFDDMIRDDKKLKRLYLECIRQYAIATNDI